MCFERLEFVLSEFYLNRLLLKKVEKTQVWLYFTPFREEVAPTWLHCRWNGSFRREPEGWRQGNHRGWRWRLRRATHLRGRGSYEFSLCLQLDAGGKACVIQNYENMKC